MSSEARFLAALLEDPDDRATPLIFADWLEERGDPRGEFLRVQTELAGWVPDLRRRTELQTRQRQLLADHEAEWLGPLREFCDEVRWQGGMAHLTLPASYFAGRQFTRAARAGWSRAWVRSVRLERAGECVDALAGSQNLGLVTALDLDGNHLNSDALAALVASRQLSGLTHLDLANNSIGGYALQSLMNTPALARLRWLDLRNNPLLWDDVKYLMEPSWAPHLRWLDVRGSPLHLTHLRLIQEWGARRGPTRLANVMGMEFVRIPAGTFLMGSPPDEWGRYSNEGPQHPVTLTRPFYLGVHAVTQAEYLAVTGRDPARFRGPNYWERQRPVDSVSWNDAVEFCRLLSEQPEERRHRRTYRLPTEAEWEHACRAGGEPDLPFHFGRRLSSHRANFNGEHPYGDAPIGPWLDSTVHVGAYQENAWGLFDMHGNVREWCEDGRDDNFYADSPPVDPVAPPTTAERICRGGSWYSFPRHVRSADRGGDGPTVREPYFGFRVVCEVGRRA